jgi:hypothetical protein
VIYIFELSLRFFVHGIGCLRESWVKFDTFLVGVGIISSWIIEPTTQELPDGLGLIMVLRVARLLRLARMARFLAQVQEFWKLIRGLLYSAQMITYVLVLVFIILYVFSSLGIELITKHKLARGPAVDPRFQAHVKMYFASLPQTMLTLIRFVTLDDMSVVYKPLIDLDPVLVVYFVCLILVLSIVLMNVIAAVIFGSSLEQTRDEQDEVQRNQEDEWARLIRDLKAMFERLDEDGRGQLSKDNMINMENEDRDRLSQALGVTSPIQIFDALDVDRSGEVSINEFFDGIWDVMLQKGDVELRRMEKQVETMHWRLKEIFGLQHESRVVVNRILKQLEMDTLTDSSCLESKQLLQGSDAPAWAIELDKSVKMLLKNVQASPSTMQSPRAAMLASLPSPLHLQKKHANHASRNSGNSNGTASPRAPNGLANRGISGGSSRNHTPRGGSRAVESGLVLTHQKDQSPFASYVRQASLNGAASATPHVQNGLQNGHSVSALYKENSQDLPEDCEILDFVDNADAEKNANSQRKNVSSDVVLSM